MYKTYLTYYAYQLYKQGYLRVNDQKNKDKIQKIIKLANAYRLKKKFPAQLSEENVGVRPVHRLSIQELVQSLDACTKNKAVADECGDESFHELDTKWIQENARTKLKTKKSLVRTFLNLTKYKRTVRQTPVSITPQRRASPMFGSPAIRMGPSKSPEE